MSATPLPVSDAIRRLLERPHGEAAAHEPLWLRRRRKEARERFLAAGLPGPKDEEWRETSLRGLAETDFAPAEPGAGAAARDGRFARLAEIGLTLVDGRTGAPAGALPDGLFLGGLGRALAERPEAVEPHLARIAPEGHPFADLNAALFEDAAVLIVPDGTRLERPVVIVHRSTGGPRPTARFPRTLVVAGRGAQLSVVEVHAGPDRGAYWTCPTSELVAGDGAVVRHHLLQFDGPDAFHTAVVQLDAGRDTDIRTLHATFGAALARADLGARLGGEGAHCALDGLYVIGGAQHADAHTTIDHAAPHGTSHELFKGILDGSATAVFKGRIIVRPGAQKTDAVQHNGNLLLSREAKINTRPQLEIHADDVRCTHGATIGRIDAEALFYLRSRGIPRPEARRMLIHAFAGEVLETLDGGPVRELLAGEIDRRIAAAAESAP